jgi:crotonobetainyl-CoA:carnitine CoA-transferase CaiB-like acyl-CoA transferase
MKRLPLTGIRVLDLSRILAGPLTAQALGDLGADVIKVERPGNGDEARRWGPPFLKDRHGDDTGESPMYLSANRNKRSITVDLSTPAGRDIVKSLAARSDVVIENFKVGDLARHGLDYASIKAVRPEIIYCSITGFGQTGPYSRHPGYDSVFQAMSGLMSVTGLPDGVPGGGPMKTGPSIADFIASQSATSAILAALYERDTHSHEGQHIDISLLETTIAAQSHYVSTYLATHVVPQRRGTEGNGGLPSQAFPCADRSIVVICGSDAQYRQLCDVLGRPTLADDDRFRTNERRLHHRTALAETFAVITRQWNSGPLLSALHQAGIPCAPILDYEEVFSDPHVVERGIAFQAEHALAGSVRFCASPIRYTGIEPRPPIAPPVLGQHTEQILREELGLDSAAIQRLRNAGVT